MGSTLRHGAAEHNRGKQRHELKRRPFMPLSWPAPKGLVRKPLKGPPPSASARFSAELLDMRLRLAKMTRLAFSTPELAEAFNVPLDQVVQRRGELARRGWWHLVPETVR